ncbi:hypothetical protein BYT27DRAFT_7183398 [Phlegmacium glaucopus]|nr:hypothetical protein BYT27DRAFT_7183398 [Phlegmacium glaucopus]
MVSILSISGPTSVRLGLDISWMLCTIIGLCNFISQAILIYRCWIVWGCNIRVIAIPSILALAFLATWLAVNALFYIIPNKGPTVTYSAYTLTLTSLAISLAVNGVVTGLIVLRILKVYWEIRPTFEDQTLGTIGGTKGQTQSIMFIMIESGMVMFTVQSVAVVLYILQLDALSIVVRINQMFYGITPTIILARVLMGLSFCDETSMVETATSSWRVESHNQNPNPEIASIDIVGQERRDHIGVQQIDDIEIVDR